MSNTNTRTLARLKYELDVLRGRLEFHSELGAFVEEDISPYIQQRALDTIEAMERLSRAIKEELKK